MIQLKKKAWLKKFPTIWEMYGGEVIVEEVK